MKTVLDTLLEEKRVLLTDGATGSNLFRVGLVTGDSPELWNDLHPDKISALAQSFIDAGVDIILTNSFGGNYYRLKLHKSEDRVAELNEKAAQLARERADRADHRVLVAGSMGPTGEIMQPLGALSLEEAADAFEMQAKALKAGGVDLLWIETMSSKQEVEAAAIGAARTGLPFVTTFSVDTNGRTMMGLAPYDIVALTQSLPYKPCAIGNNCGLGPSESIAAVINMKTACEEQGCQPAIIVKANCGIPQYVNGEIVYSGTQEVMGEYVKFAIDSGATIIGGCCGTTPEHVAAMRRSMDRHVQGERPDLYLIQSQLGQVSPGAIAQISGKMSIEAGTVSGRMDERKRRRRRG